MRGPKKLPQKYCISIQRNFISQIQQISYKQMRMDLDYHYSNIRIAIGEHSVQIVMTAVHLRNFHTLYVLSSPSFNSKYPAILISI